MHVVIFTGGTIRKGMFITKALETADKIIAVDSGAKTAFAYGKTPNIVIGDFDSIDPLSLNASEEQVKKGKLEIIKYPKNKNETDTELSIDEAVKIGATKITIVGGIEGDRLDHVLANIFLLTQYEIPIKLVNGNQKTWALEGPKEDIIHGEKNDLLSLIPLNNNVTGITTDGLQYQLNKETLFAGKARGISNVFLKTTIKVTFDKGILLFVHTMI